MWSDSVLGACMYSTSADDVFSSKQSHVWSTPRLSLSLRIRCNAQLVECLGAFNAVLSWCTAQALSDAAL